MSNHSITRWIGDLRAGDAAAADAIWRAYFESIRKLAERRLPEHRKRVADGEDVALDVLATLCKGVAEHRFDKLHDRQDLWALLLALTRQKTSDYLRRELRLKRGGGAVRGDSIFSIPGSSAFQGLDLLVCEEPTPQLIIEFRETASSLMQSLGDDRLRSIAQWRLEGFNNTEIASRLGIGLRTVERKLDLIRTRWSRLLEDD